LGFGLGGWGLLVTQCFRQDQVLGKNIQNGGIRKTTPLGRGSRPRFKRDWDQTEHDVGHEPDTDEHVSDTVKQAAGKEAIPPRGMPNYEETEDAYRFG
jgi:hypothetical protein